jgi:hypothetical protein
LEGSRSSRQRRGSCGGRGLHSLRRLAPVAINCRAPLSRRPRARSGEAAPALCVAEVRRKEHGRESHRQGGGGGGACAGDFALQPLAFPTHPFTPAPRHSTGSEACCARLRPLSALPYLWQATADLPRSPHRAGPVVLGSAPPPPAPAPSSSPPPQAPSSSPVAPAASAASAGPAQGSGVRIHNTLTLIRE